MAFNVYISGGSVQGDIVSAVITTPASPTVPPTPSTAATSRDIEWSFILCDLTGDPITILDNVATARTITYTLNRPATATFAVPSDDPKANLLHTDSDPYLNEMNRVLKCYRLEETGWVLRFAGIVYQIQDEADETGCRSSVTAFDPSQVLYSRIVMDGSGVIKTVTSTDFSDSHGSAIARELVDYNVGNTGTAYLDTTGGTFDATTVQTVTFEEGYTVGQALETLTETGTMDVIFEPLDSTAGLFATMSVVAERGNNSTTAIFGYDTLNYAVKSFRRLKDGSQLANDVYVNGNRPAKTVAWQVSNAQDATSVTKYGVYQSWRAADPDITDQTFLDDLSAAELRFRKQPRETLAVTPFPERGPVPFNEYFLGDTVYFYCSTNARKAIQGAQRVYGLSIDISDNAFETVGEIVVAAA